jgi:hypothetical protein
MTPSNEPPDTIPAAPAVPREKPVRFEVASPWARTWATGPR